MEKFKTDSAQKSFLPGIVLIVELPQKSSRHGQTTVPEDTLKHNGWAKKLGSKGLGEALVNLPNVSRSVFNFSLGISNYPALRKHNIGFPENRDMSLWLRRSSFLIENRPLWVVEIFLSKICELK